MTDVISHSKRTLLELANDDEELAIQALWLLIESQDVDMNDETAIINWCNEHLSPPETLQ